MLLTNQKSTYYVKQFIEYVLKDNKDIHKTNDCFIDSFL